MCRLLSCGMWTLSCGTHVRTSSPTRDWTQAHCIGSSSLTHWTTREVPKLFFSQAINKNLKCWKRTPVVVWNSHPAYFLRRVASTHVRLFMCDRRLKLRPEGSCPFPQSLCELLSGRTCTVRAEREGHTPCMMRVIVVNSKLWLHTAL